MQKFLVLQLALHWTATGLPEDMYWLNAASSDWLSGVPTAETHRSLSRLFLFLALNFLIGVRHFRRRSSGMHTACVCSWWQKLRENLSAPSHGRPDTTYDQKFRARYRNILNNPVRCSQCYRCSCLGGTDRKDERLFLIKCFRSIKYIKLLKEGVST